MFDLLSALCNISVYRVVFSDWCEEIGYMIPKESGVDLLENQRPLKLQEALRKVTAGTKKNIDWPNYGRRQIVKVVCVTQDFLSPAAPACLA
jgi:hypothetical protein